jgi:ABC-type phosphate transport system substrate-binding protein
MLSTSTPRKSAKRWLAPAAVLTGVGVALAGALPAAADPVGTPEFRLLAGVGSDTTQDLNNGLSQAVLRNGVKVLGSYNATNPAGGAQDQIQTKENGPEFLRPNGSGSGVNALRAAKTDALWNGTDLPSDTLQFARSSSNISSANANPNGAYSYIPLALDAVSYAYEADDIDLGNLTDADLVAIYTAEDGDPVTLSNDETYVVGLESNAEADIHPFIPQEGSGTRSFWLSDVLGGQAPGSAVDDEYSGGSVQEHDGSVVADVEGAIVPFSVAQYIAQGNSTTLASAYGLTVENRRHGVELGSVNGKAPVTTGGTLNTAFDIVRPVFTVVEHAEITGTTPTGEALSAVFEGSNALAYNARRPGGLQLVVQDFGFGDIRGGVTIDGDTYTAGDISLRSN